MGLKIYSVDDVMEILKLSRRTIYIYIRKGELLGNKVAGKWLFTEEQIMDFVQGKNKNLKDGE